jgi:hypothetical protein
MAYTGWPEFGDSRAELAKVTDPQIAKEAQLALEQLRA